MPWFLNLHGTEYTFMPIRYDAYLPIWRKNPSPHNMHEPFLAFHAFPYLMVYPKKSFTSSFMSFGFMIGSFRILLMNLYAMNEEVS
jgi:hypothetical protein